MTSATLENEKAGMENFDGRSIGMKRGATRIQNGLSARRKTCIFVTLLVAMNIACLVFTAISTDEIYKLKYEIEEDKIIYQKMKLAIEVEKANLKENLKRLELEYSEELRNRLQEMLANEKLKQEAKSRHQRSVEDCACSPGQKGEKGEPGIISTFAEAAEAKRKQDENIEAGSPGLTGNREVEHSPHRIINCPQGYRSRDAVRIIKRNDERACFRPGPPGPPGPQGVAGPAGEKGEPGLPGQKGLKGEIGMDGQKGAKGNMAVVGLGKTVSNENLVQTVGPPGPPGSPGLPGPPGVGQIGPKGERGPKGDKGEEGLRGSMGLVGLKGDKGELGPAGLPGLQGPSGKQGTRGRRGQRGKRGRKGQKGENGAPGLDAPCPIGSDGLPIPSCWVKR